MKKHHQSLFHVMNDFKSHQTNELLEKERLIEVRITMKENIWVDSRTSVRKQECEL